jgi:uncharacterized protein YigE (DUF2233 family)
MIAMRFKIAAFLLFLFTIGKSSIGQCPADNDSFVTYCVNLKVQTIRFYWKDDNGQLIRNFDNLRTWLDKKGQKLIFAMNGGMYKTDNAPLGLFVEEEKVISPLNKANASGNFYLKPNGVFYITSNNTAVICTTEKFKMDTSIKYATQSGPMLLIDGNIHSGFKKGSMNVNIRNGVGILPSGQVMFVMSKQLISFYDFADYFKKAGCEYALYLDGFVSRTYLPGKKWVQTDGDFGVIIAETTPNK